MKKCCYHVLYLGRTWQLTAQKNAHASAILPTFTWRHRGKVGQRPASHSQPPTALIMVSFECIRYQPLTSSLLQFFHLHLISSHKMQLLTTATVKLLHQRAPPFKPVRFTWSLGITSRSRWAATTKGPTCQELFLLDVGGGSYGWTNTWFLLEMCQKKTSTHQIWGIWRHGYKLWFY